MVYSQSPQPIGGKGSNGIGALITAISKFPPEWALTPCVGKENLWTGWKTIKLDRTELIEAIRTQKNGKGKHTAWTGVSIVTGELSNGVMAIDFDGPLALTKYLQLSGGASYPTTKQWSSGKEGHFQILLEVPKEKWEGLKATKFFILNPAPRLELGLSAEEIAQAVGTTGEKIEQWEAGTTSSIPQAIAKKLTEIYGCSNSELCQKLEFRWNECSTLPPSIHPGTQKPYFWENDGEIAQGPDLILELMREAPTIELPQKPKPKNPTYIDVGEKNLVEILENEILPRLDAEEFYGNWVALKSSGQSLKGLCPFHEEKTGSFNVSPAEKLFKCFGCGVGGGPVQFLHQIKGGAGSPTGKEFYEVVMELADRTGVQIPDRKFQKNSDIKAAIDETSSNVIPLFPSNSSCLREAITELINAGIAGSELTEAIFSLAGRNNPQIIWRIYHEILEETERADQRLDRKADVENLLKISNRRLKLENYLHPSLAEPIKKVSDWMGVDPEAVLTHLLPITAGLINPNSRVVAKECINFKEPFLFYSGVVALSGARKTPTLDTVKAPLVKLQSVEDVKHEQALQVYEAELQALKETKGKDKGNDELPQKPKPPREFYLDNATVEAVDKVKGQQPDHGVTLIKDELSGLFASHGAYKGGKGSDKESYLSGWNGGGVKKNRAGDGSRVSLARDSLSITGGIQPDKLRELLGDFSDSQGEWARFLWYHMPMRPYKIPRDDTRYDLGDLLEGIYKKIDALPVLKLRFDKQGQTYWDDWHDAKDEQKRAETRPGLQAAIAKMPGQSVRLIGILHVLWEVASGSADVPEEIPLAIVKSGIQLAEFYLGQVTLLQSQGDADTGELAPTLQKLLEKVAESKTLTARLASQSIRDLKQTKAPKVRELFAELKAMGLAETQGTGARMILVQKVLADSKDSQKDQNPYPVDILGNNTLEVLASVDKVLTSNLQPQTYADAVFQDEKQQSVGTVDAIETFDLSPPSPELVDPISSGEDKQLREISNEVANTPTLSTQRYIEQAIESVGKTSTVDANIFESVNTFESVDSQPEEPIAPQPKKSKPEIKIGDRVVIARSDSPRYRGVKGEVIADCWGANGLEFYVRFDKKISNILQDYFPATDVMRESC